MNKIIRLVAKQGTCIGIVGPIAAGKSTLCKGVSKKESSIVVVNEESKNYPHFKEYYKYKDQRPRKLAPSGLSFPADIQKFSFEWRKEQYILGEKNIKNGQVVLFDMLLHTDIAYAMANEKDMFEEEYKDYLRSFQAAMKERRKPDVIIYLDCSPKTSLNRIRKRGRDGEDALSDEDWLNYLKDMEKIYKGPWMKYMKKIGCKVIVVNWNTFPDDITSFFEEQLSHFFQKSE